MIITASMPYERVEVMLFDLFKGGRLDREQIRIVLGIKNAIKERRTISDAQAWRAREIVSEVLDNDPLIDDKDGEPEPEAQPKLRFAGWEEF